MYQFCGLAGLEQSIAHVPSSVAAAAVDASVAAFTTAPAAKPKAAVSIAKMTRDVMLKASWMTRDARGSGTEGRCSVAVALVADRLTGVTVAVVVHIAYALARYAIVEVSHVPYVLALQAVRVIGVRPDILTGDTIVVVGVISDLLRTEPITAIHHATDVLTGLRLRPNANEHCKRNSDGKFHSILPRSLSQGIAICTGKQAKLTTVTGSATDPASPSSWEHKDAVRVLEWHDLLWASTVKFREAL